MAETPTLQARMVPLDELVESPTNPRRRSCPEQDREMLESVKQHGVLQPVLARPVNGHLELVFGHRRLAAARAAGRADLPVLVRNLSDLEALEAQLVENSARADVAPWDEAIAYKRLHTGHGRSVDEIAAKVGKSRGHIYGRLKLLELCAAGQKALEKGELEATVALLVARVPEKLQPEALKAVLGWRGEGGVSLREAQHIVQHQFMLRLGEASFDRAAADLVPEAGPCTTCPKRTGNQVELFGDVKSADLCTDPTCYRKKSDAAWKLRTAAARAAGHEVLEGKAAEKARYSPEFVKLDDRCWEDGKQRTYAKLLGKDAPPTVLLRQREGDVVELARKADVQKALRAKGIRTQRDESHHTGRNPAQDTARKRELELARQVLGQLAGRAPQFTNGLLDGWRWLARAAVEAAWHDSLELVVARRGLERALLKQKHGPKHEGYAETLFRWIDAATVADAQGLAVEVLCARSLHSLQRDEDDLTMYGAPNQAARLACELAGVDVAALRAAIKAEDDAKRKAKKPAAKARSKKKAPKTAKAKAPKVSKKKAAATAKKLAKASRDGEEAFAQVVGELHGPSTKKKAAKPKASKPPRKKVQTCRECSCTNEDCSQCIAKTGAPCTWVAPDLCSACEVTA